MTQGKKTALAEEAVTSPRPLSQVSRQPLKLQLEKARVSWAGSKPKPMEWGRVRPCNLATGVLKRLAHNKRAVHGGVFIPVRNSAVLYARDTPIIGWINVSDLIGYDEMGFRC